MSDFGDDLDRAEGLAAAERQAGVARLQAALVGLHQSDRCDDCDAPIPPARRAAAPWATRCVQCQQSFERGRG